MMMSPVGATLIEDLFEIEFDSVFVEQAEQFILMAHRAMMLFLVEDVSFHRKNVGALTE